VSLTRATGPLGPERAGTFNFAPEHAELFYLEPSARWVRAEFGGEIVVDSRAVKLLHEVDCLPVYYFPPDDVTWPLLESTDLVTSSPLKGDAVHWSIRVADRVAENAAYSYQAPVESARALAGLVAFKWRALDRWWEEAEEVHGYHPRDPYHRVDVLSSERHVRVCLEGHELADSTRAKVVYETAHPPRWYVPYEDVRQELFEPLEFHTTCAYKGQADYWSVRVGERSEMALAWRYPRPRPEASALAGLVCFFAERVDLELDGVLQERPRTGWSSDGWTARAARR
jgi:uncharacterized protein (DUF427 family)